jgi:hypothetical protein
MAKATMTSKTKPKAPLSAAPPAAPAEAASEIETPEATAAPKPAKAKKTAPKADRPENAEDKKAKLIRDSFTLPESDYATIKQLKERCLTAGIEVKKSEIVRVALNILAKQTEQKLISAVKALPRIKTGRPKKAR